MDIFKIAAYLDSPYPADYAICDAITGKQIEITSRDEATRFDVCVFATQTNTLPPYSAKYGYPVTEVQYPDSYPAYHIEIFAGSSLVYEKLLTIGEINKTAGYAEFMAGTAQTFSLEIPPRTLPSGTSTLKIHAYNWGADNSGNLNNQTIADYTIGTVRCSVGQAGGGAFQNRIRMKLDAQNFKERAVNILTGESAAFYNRNSIRFEFAVFKRAALANLAEFTKFDFCIKDATADFRHSDPADTTARALKETDAIDESLTLEAWNSAAIGSNHFAFELSPEEANVGAGGKWLIVRGYTSDGGIVTFYAGRLYVVEDGRGPVTAPEDITLARDKAVEAAKAAAEDREAVEQMKNDIGDAAEAVSGYATAVAEDKNAVAEMKTSVEGTKTQIDASAQQVAQDRAAAEIAAGTAVNSSDLAALSRRAANVGFYQFDGGTVACIKSAAQPAIFSWARTIKMSPADWAAVPLGTALDGTLNIGTGLTSATGISIWRYTSTASGLWICCRQVSGGSLSWELQISNSNTNKIFDGKLHTFVLCGDGAAIKAYLDGVLLQRWNYAMQAIPAPYAPHTIGNTSIKGLYLSRICNFNFDMSAEGAPYTVADYAASIEPSPALMQGVIATTDPTMGASTGEGWTQGAVSGTTGANGDWRFGTGTSYVKNRELTQSDYDGGLPEGVTSAVDLKTTSGLDYNGVLSNFCNNAVDFSQYAGKVVKAKISFWMRNNAVTSKKTITIGSVYSVFKQINAADQTNYPNGAWRRFSEIVECKFPASAAATNYRIGVAANSKGADDSDYCVSIADFKFEVIGAQLSLADAADSSQIRDESSNGNHALISGAVLPSKSNNPAHCSQTITWAGTSTLQNVCGDSAIPANCKVTAYAKATGAVTASFKAGTNTAQSKDLAANTLTEIGSWLCGAAGAFSVQPSAAYTGSIETYLTIERL